MTVMEAARRVVGEVAQFVCDTAVDLTYTPKQGEFRTAFARREMRKLRDEFVESLPADMRERVEQALNRTESE